jgi:small subunit ribosomal protein S8
MNINDPVGDLITRIRNAQMRGKSAVHSPLSKMRVRVLTVLADEGYIRGFSEVEKEGRTELQIELKYYEGQPVIQDITRVSKPGRRVYSSIKDLGLVRNGLGISILSTPKGVMSDAAARAQNVGGEVLCKVY